MVVALLVVPLQIALVPILKDFSRLGLNGTFLAMWLAHTGFGLPLATYLLFNYIATLPRETLELAFIDGASHFTIFIKLILPLSIPALASFAIFQFLWVWNDYLVALIFLGSDPNLSVVTMQLANIVGDRGTGLAPLNGRCVPYNGCSFGGLLRPAALLCSWNVSGICERLTRDQMNERYTKRAGK